MSFSNILEKSESYKSIRKIYRNWSRLFETLIGHICYVASKTAERAALMSIIQRGSFSYDAR